MVILRQAPISYSVESYPVFDRGYFREHIERLQPRGLSIINDHDFALSLRAPSRKIIYRHMPTVQGAPPNEDPDKDIHKKMTPPEWASAFLPLAAPGLILQLNQEPHGYEYLQPLNAHTAACIELAGRQDVPVAAIGFGVGHPYDGGYSTMGSTFEMLDRYHHLGSGLSVHLYGKDSILDPDRVMRYREALAYTRMRGLRLRIYVTEYGLDEPLFRERGMTDADLVNQLVLGWQEIFAHDPEVEFACAFAWTINQRWLGKTDLAHADLIHKRLEQIQADTEIEPPHVLKLQQHTDAHYVLSYRDELRYAGDSADMHFMTLPATWGNTGIDVSDQPTLPGAEPYLSITYAIDGQTDSGLNIWTDGRSWFARLITDGNDTEYAIRQPRGSSIEVWLRDLLHGQFIEPSTDPIPVPTPPPPPSPPPEPEPVDDITLLEVLKAILKAILEFLRKIASNTR